MPTPTPPSPAPATEHPALRDRVIAAIARLLAGGFFRSIETVGPVPQRGPVILAASHLNGFVDPVVMVARLGRLPRFLAKATLWNVAVARPLLGFARVIPVHRRQDSDGTVDNRSTFADAVDALRAGHLLAIFPEGTTHDDPSLRPLRTGVSRIAIEAASDGVAGLSIVPVGVSYEDKVAVRGRVVVHFGEPIEVSAGEHQLDESGDPDPEAVRALTDQLRTRLDQVTPHFRSTEEAIGVTAAARVSLSTGDRTAAEVPVADIAARSRRVVAAGPEAVDGVVSAAARYQMLLNSVALTDDDLHTPNGLQATIRRTVWLAVLVVLLAPLAVAGLFANLLPVLLVLLAGLIPKAPVSKGTIRFLVAAVVFPLTWAAIAVWDVGGARFSDPARTTTFPLTPLLEALFSGRGGAAASILVFVSLPILGLVALLLVDRLRALVHGLQVWRTLLDRRGQLAEVMAKRDEVVAVTAAAVGER